MPNCNRMAAENLERQWKKLNVWAYIKIGFIDPAPAAKTSGGDSLLIEMCCEFQCKFKHYSCLRIRDRMTHNKHVRRTRTALKIFLRWAVLCCIKCRMGLNRKFRWLIFVFHRIQAFWVKLIQVTSPFIATTLICILFMFSHGETEY